MYKAKIEVLILRPLLSTEKQSLMDCTQENDRFFQGQGCWIPTSQNCTARRTCTPVTSKLVQTTPTKRRNLEGVAEYYETTLMSSSRRPSSLGKGKK